MFTFSRFVHVNDGLKIFRHDEKMVNKIEDKLKEYRMKKLKEHEAHLRAMKPLWQIILPSILVSFIQSLHKLFTRLLYKTLATESEVIASVDIDKSDSDCELQSEDELKAFNASKAHLRKSRTKTTIGDDAAPSVFHHLTI